jgi:Zn-dependent protease
MNNDVLLGCAWYVIFILSLSFHEAAHAFAALMLGDKTAFHGGQVSLDPFVHIRREPIGMVVLPILSYFYNGWMIGWASTPYDRQWAARYPKREILMSLAGPVANLILVLIAAAIIRVGISLGYFYPPETITFSHVTATDHTGLANGIVAMTSILFTLNLVLLIFNLLPVPPLDGSSIVPLFLSSENARKYKEFISRPANSIIGLIIAWQFFGYIFHPIHTIVLNILYPGSHYS